MLFNAICAILEAYNFKRSIKSKTKEIWMQMCLHVHNYNEHRYQECYIIMVLYHFFCFCILLKQKYRKVTISFLRNISYEKNQ